MKTTNINGFTLVEVLISMVITGILGALIISFFTSIQRSTTEQRYVSTQTAVIQRALGLMGDDVRRADLIVANGTARTLSAGSTGLVIPVETGNNRIDLLVKRPSTGSSCDITDQYEYHSYFTVVRSSLATLSDPWLSLPDDTANTSKTVLMLYVGCTSDVSVAPTLRGIRIFADYIDIFAVAYGTANDVSISLQGRRTILGRELRSPLSPAVATYYSRRI